mgnify:CR=1 FL=1
MYAKKDYNLAKHPQVDALNLEVIKLMQSFKSKEYVRIPFCGSTTTGTWLTTTLSSSAPSPTCHLRSCPIDPVM